LFLVSLITGKELCSLLKEACGKAYLIYMEMNWAIYVYVILNLCSRYNCPEDRA